MLDVQQLRRRATRFDASEFRQHYEGLYFVGTMSATEPDSYNTFQRGTTMKEMEAYSRRNRGPRDVPYVIRIEKTERNHWTRQISVGRAANNDVIILHPAVSKLHALLTVEADERHLRLKQLLLADADSSNGTRINGLRAPGTDQPPAPITVGDRIAFGHVVATLADVSALRHWLQRPSIR